MTEVESDETGPFHTITFEELARLLTSDYKDARVLFAVAVAACCGLRRGELRGLQFRDISLKKKMLYVRRNWIDDEGMKGPKWESFHDVFFPDALVPIFLRLKNELETASKAKVKQSDFVLYSLSETDKPVSIAVLRRGFENIFDVIGIDAAERKTRKLTGLHSLRHSFASLMQAAGISRLDTQHAIGHAVASTTDIYSHSMLDFAAGRKKLDAAILAAKSLTDTDPADPVAVSSDK